MCLTRKEQEAYLSPAGLGENINAVSQQMADSYTKYTILRICFVFSPAFGGKENTLSLRSLDKHLLDIKQPEDI